MTSVPASQTHAGAEREGSGKQLVVDHLLLESSERTPKVYDLGTAEKQHPGAQSM